MTRRQFICIAAPMAAASSVAQVPLIVPVHEVMDDRSKCTPEQLHRFRASLWSEAVRDFNRCGIQFKTSEGAGAVRLSPGGRPVFTGLEHGAINLVLTDHIPMEWDNGRALEGVATRYDGYDFCMIAMRYAHAHRIPFLSVNTCVHELLHVLVQDIFVPRPKGMPGEEREFRIDSYATRLWLFHECAPVRKSAEAYVERLRKLG